MSAAQLVSIHSRKRAGATVVAPDGAEAIVWGATQPVTRDAWGRTRKDGPALVWLWRDGALHEPTPEAQARRLELVGAHPAYVTR